MKTVIAFGSCLLLPLVLACGKASEAAAPAAGTPAMTAAPAAPLADDAEGEPTTLAEAEARLERARADLDRLALNEPGAASPANAGAAAPSPPPPAAAPREERAAEKSADQASQAPKKEASACETACKAFFSLARASDAVCRLDTDPSAKRCERAKQIREDAARRVTSCSCAQ